MNQGRPQFSLKVLVVEDYEFNAEIITEMLALFGVTPDLASNGQEAVEKVEKTNYDLIFMDVKMPVMDGYTATKKIRAMKVPQPIIVALTASTLIREEAQYIECGMTDYLLKPTELTDIEQCLRKHFPDKK